MVADLLAHKDRQIKELAGWFQDAVNMALGTAANFERIASEKEVKYPIAAEQERLIAQEIRRRVAEKYQPLIDKAKGE